MSDETVIEDALKNKKLNDLLPETQGSTSYNKPLTKAVVNEAIGLLRKRKGLVLISQALGISSSQVHLIKKDVDKKIAELEKPKEEAEV